VCPGLLYQLTLPGTVPVQAAYLVSTRHAVLEYLLFYVTATRYCYFSERTGLA